MKIAYGHYQLVSELGRGGMGVVYKALDTELDRHVAIKVLAEGLAHDAGIVERFQREARAVAALDDANVVHIYATGTQDGRPYFVMEFVDGVSLDVLLQREQRLAPAQAARLIAQAAKGLASAHAKGLIHRDVKPANILVSRRGVAKVSDFGIVQSVHAGNARLTTTGAFLGTPGYLAPERYAGAPADARTDIFALGVVLFECLSGERPFTGDSPLAVMRAVADTPLPDIRALNPDVDAELARILARMTAKDPAQRYPDCEALIADLDRHFGIGADTRLALAVWQAPELPLTARLGGVTTLNWTRAFRQDTQRRKFVKWALAVALLVMGGVVIGRWMATTRGPTPVAEIPEKSIAVLPFANEGGKADEQFFSDGLSDDLIDALSQFDGLKVISRNSAFQFRGSKESSRAIGQKLGVAHLLEGSVQRVKDQVRITATLVNAADSSTLWSQRYDKPYTDLFALQDTITAAVAEALKARLQIAPGAVVQSERPPGGNLAAYMAYKQGVAWLALGTEAGARSAIEAFDEAIRLDPHYAAANAQLSMAWVGLAGLFLSGTEAAQANARGRVAAEAALRLDPDSSLAHQARSLLLTSVDMDWRGAEAEAQRALQLAPNDAVAKFNLGAALAALGQNRRAAALTREALADDPRHANWYTWLSTYLTALGQWDEARQAIDSAIALQPDASVYHVQLAIIDILRGDAAAALAAARQEPAGVWQDVALALALQIGPDRSAADAALKHLTDAYADQSAYQIAQTYALRGDPDSMFQWLDRAWAQRDSGIGYVLGDPLILRYRQDPRFAAFCRKVGLPAPADASAPLAEGAIPDKSIAVLPFENLSDDKANVYFAAGMQDLILTKLSGIGDLKVISRASTEKYGARPTDLKTIGQQLGVATILEGSVQRAGNQVLINVQLIDTRSDTHVWAQDYPRRLDNLFGVEGEVAQKVADALKARLSPAETANLAAVPTENQAALDAFLHAEYAANRGKTDNDTASLKAALPLYREAVTQDPRFALAFARLSYVESELAWLNGGGGLDVKQLTTQARADAGQALKLAPNLAEAHLAVGYSDYYGRGDYAAARKAFDAALALRPNDADALAARGYVERREGRFDAAIASLQAALAHDPRNSALANDLGETCMMAGRYADAASWLQRALALDPTNLSAKIDASNVILLRNGDAQGALAAAQGDEPVLQLWRADMLTYQRKYADAIALLDGVPDNADNFSFVRGSKSLQLANLYRLAGESARAQPLYAQARTQAHAELSLQQGGDLATVWSNLAAAELGLGNTQQGLDAIARSQAIVTATGDKVSGAAVMQNNAVHYAQARRADLAVPLLEAALASPGIGFYYSPAMLKIDPAWDAIRDDPRFKELLNTWTADTARP